MRFSVSHSRARFKISKRRSMLIRCNSTNYQFRVNYLAPKTLVCNSTNYQFRVNYLAPRRFLQLAQTHMFLHLGHSSSVFSLLNTIPGYLKHIFSLRCHAHCAENILLNHAPLAVHQPARISDSRARHFRVLVDMFAIVAGPPRSCRRPDVAGSCSCWLDVAGARCWLGSDGSSSRGRRWNDNPQRRCRGGMTAQRTRSQRGEDAA